MRIPRFSVLLLWSGLVLSTGEVFSQPISSTSAVRPRMITGVEQRSTPTPAAPATPKQPSPTALDRSARSPGQSVENLWDKWIPPAISSFAGAFAGAWVVFFLQGRKEKRQGREEETRELLKVQFALSRRVAALDMLWSQWLRPAKESLAVGHWAVLQMPSGFVPPEPLSLERIAFLLRTDANLLGTLDRNEQAFQGILGTVDQYSKWRDEASKRVEELSEGRDLARVSAAEIQTIAGPRLHRQLSTLAESMYERSPNLRSELLDTFTKLGEHIRVKYGGKPLVAVEAG